VSGLLDRVRALAGVPDRTPRNETITFQWMSRPGRDVPEPAPPSGDAWSDDDGRWRAVG
jgi:hypothetical protein